MKVYAWIKGTDLNIDGGKGSHHIQFNISVTGEQLKQIIDEYEGNKGLIELTLCEK